MLVEIATRFVALCLGETAFGLRLSVQDAVFLGACGVADAGPAFANSAEVDDISHEALDGL
jgi:hypothetical protein